MSEVATTLVFGYRYLRSALPDIVWYGTLEFIRSVRMEPMMDYCLKVPIADLTEDGRYRVIDRLRPAPETVMRRV